MTLQSRTASGKQAMIQSANQAVGDASAPPSAAWYLTKIEMEPGLTTATMSGGATDFDTAISLSIGTGANLPDNTNTPYRVKVTNALYPGVFEVMNVTNIAGDTITVERGKDETDAQIWGPSSVVAPRFIEPTYKVALTLVASRPVVIAESDDGIVLCEYSSAFVSGSTYETTYILHCHDPADGSVIWSHTVSETTTGASNTFGAVGSITGDDVVLLVRQWAGPFLSPSTVDCKLILLSMTDGSETWDTNVSSAHLSVSGAALDEIAVMARIVADDVVVVTHAASGTTTSVYTHSFQVSDGARSSDVATISRSGSSGGAPCSITPSGIVLFFVFLGSYNPYTAISSRVYEVSGSTVTDTTRGAFVMHPITTYSHAYSAYDDAAYIYSHQSGATSAQLRKLDLYAYTQTDEVYTVGMGGPSNIADGPRFAEAGGFIYGLSFFNSDMEPIFSPRPARENTDGEFVSYTNAFTPISDRAGSMYFISANYDKVHNYIDDL